MRNYRHLDWLEVTIAQGVEWRGFLTGCDWRETGQGSHGYNCAYIDALSGVTLQTASDDPLMGHHFTMSGDPLAEYKASRQVSDDDLARRIVQYDGRVSRCDLTTDVWDCSFSPSLLANDLKHKIARIRARTWRLIEGHARGIDGDTLDTGSKSSDKRFRMYDKYAEKRIRDKGSWMRLELQLRRKYARAAVGSCVDNGTEPTITGHIADYLRWDNLEYQQVMIDDSVAPARIPRPDSNRQKWLKGQVAQALASELYVNPDFQADFDIMVSFWLEHLHKSSNGDTLA